jgi:hypothetical protein
MSIVPVSSLDPTDFARLGNNVLPEGRCRRSSPYRPPPPHDLRALNRSLAAHGERVGRLYPAMPWPAPRPSRRARVNRH